MTGRGSYNSGQLTDKQHDTVPCYVDMADVRIVNRETLSDKKYRLESIEIEKTSRGQTETQIREVYFRPSAASILLHDPERKTVLLTRQFRLPVYLSHRKPEMIIEACAGVIDEGELPEHAVIREVEEETGYRISEIRQIAEGFSSPASFMEYVYFFTGIYSPDLKVNEGGGKKEEGEDIDLVELPASEARKMLETGQIRDVKTIILLQHAVISGII